MDETTATTAPDAELAPEASQLVGWYDRSWYEVGYALPLQFIAHVRRAQEGARHGDDRACDQLVGRIYRTVYCATVRRLRGLPGDEDIATEVTHEALLHLSTAIEQCRATTDRQAWGWIWAIVRRARMDYLRRELPGLRHRILHDSLGLAEVDDTPWDWRDSLNGAGSPEALLIYLVVKAYDALPEPTMEVLYDRVQLGLSYAEVARRHATTVAGAKRRVQRALAALRRTVVRLVEEGGEVNEAQAEALRSAIAVRGSASGRRAT